MKINRIQQIRKLLLEEHTLSIKDLCRRFDVSKNTIRRDICELEQQGLIHKVYGGIVLNEDALDPSAPEPFDSRATKNENAKKIVARLAASEVREDDVIYIDSGTTTMHMIPFLTGKGRITIITSSLNVINMALDYPSLDVLTTSGALYVPSKAFVGSSVIRCLRDFNISKIFLASTGISIEHGATNASPLECEIKRYLADLPSKKYLLVDHSTIDVASLLSYASLASMHCLVLDKLPPERYQTYCATNNVRLLTPETSVNSRTEDL